MDDKPVVLIVDDIPTNIQVLATCLKEQYSIKVATLGKQCIELANSVPKPDLILLDIEMPGMDGYEVCCQLKSDASTSSIPVIFVTAKDNNEDEALGLQLGAVDYITKPFHPDIILARVHTQITLKRQHDMLEKMALYDQLTWLYNRHYLLETANHKVANAMRHEHALSLLMIDIDHFKMINDEHGHPTGDIILQTVARILRGQTRKEDVAARFGGEEFVMILDHCDLADAEIKAEKLRHMVEAAIPEEIVVTISIGVAELQVNKANFEDLLKCADLALYQAKEQGRNQVVIYNKSMMKETG